MRYSTSRTAETPRHKVRSRADIAPAASESSAADGHHSSHDSSHATPRIPSGPPRPSASSAPLRAGCRRRLPARHRHNGHPLAPCCEPRARTRRRASKVAKKGRSGYRRHGRAHARAATQIWWPGEAGGASHYGRGGSSRLRVGREQSCADQPDRPAAAAHLTSFGHVIVRKVDVLHPPAQAAAATRKPSSACTRGRSCSSSSRAQQRKRCEQRARAAVALRRSAEEGY